MRLLCCHHLQESIYDAGLSAPGLQTRSRDLVADRFEGVVTRDIAAGPVGMSNHDRVIKGRFLLEVLGDECENLARDPGNRQFVEHQQAQANLDGVGVLEGILRAGFRAWANPAARASDDLLRASDFGL